jgi:hypothetical protein
VKSGEMDIVRHSTTSRITNPQFNATKNKLRCRITLTCSNHDTTARYWSTEVSSCAPSPYSTWSNQNSRADKTTFMSTILVSWCCLELQVGQVQWDEEGRGGRRAIGKTTGCIERYIQAIQLYRLYVMCCHG